MRSSVACDGRSDRERSFLSPEKRRTMLCQNLTHTDALRFFTHYDQACPLLLVAFLRQETI